jgi:hypothetical protein
LQQRSDFALPHTCLTACISNAPPLPARRRFQECLWGSERKVADVDTQGVEDPKLFVWPGKGVYAVFGR